jgi:hypothetical protein
MACIWSVVEMCRQQGRSVGLPDGLPGRSRRRAHDAVVVAPAKNRSCRLTVKRTVRDYMNTVMVGQVAEGTGEPTGATLIGAHVRLAKEILEALPRRLSIHR